MTGQLDRVHRQTTAPQCLGHRLEVHRVAAGVRKAHEGAGLRTIRFRPIRFRQGLQQLGLPVGPAVHDARQVREDRMRRDLLEGYRPVES